MNNKEFVIELSKRLELSQKEVNLLIDNTVEVLTTQLIANKLIQIADFGSFEVKKKNERITVNPTTKTRMLVPPKLAIHFKQSIAIKDKLKEL